ncbi:MAG TPA: tetratricopeptide repeat protein [Candidatus Paceibacterota bacterium]|nr:tetratricopeptide repeat protein [Candidatus Paceibacterota bacterium]
MTNAEHGEHHHREHAAAEHSGGEQHWGIAKMLLGKVGSHKIFSEQVLFGILVATVFLLPIFFIPGSSLAPELTKMILLEAVTLFGVLAWGLSRIADGRFEIPRSILLAIGGLIVAVFAFAGAMSPAPQVSFFGSGFDIGTVSSALILFLLMFLSSLVFRDRDRILYLYAAMLFSTIVVVFYHIVRFFAGAEFLSFDIFTSQVATPVGKWNDLASLVGATMLLLVMTSYFFPMNRAVKIVSGIMSALALAFLVAIDFKILWFILLVLGTGIGIFAFREGEEKHRHHAKAAAEGGAAHTPVHPIKRYLTHIPVALIALIVIACVYTTGLSTKPFGKDGASIAGTIGQTLNLPPYSEVVLNPSYTFGLVKSVLSDSPVFGSGPNRFSTPYLMYKSTDMNRTPFWDATFDFGIGRIPTYFGTTGIPGVVLWVIFLAVLVWKFTRVWPVAKKDRIAAYLGLSLFILTIYFWSLSFFYLPNISIFTLAFLFTGALVAYLVSEGALGMITFDPAKSSRFAFAMTPIAVIVVAGALSAGVLLYRQTVSVSTFVAAQEYAQAGDLAKAEASARTSLEYVERDATMRFLSALSLAKLQRLANDQGTNSDAVIAEADRLIRDARTFAEGAVAYDNTNFENHLSLGSVYDTLGALGVGNTAAPARAAYEDALKRNPKSPRVFFILARLELLSGNRALAKEYFYKALAERPNYLEAVSVIAQLELEDRNPAKATAALEGAVGAEPTNFLLRFSLGYLYYASRNYDAAVPQLEAAVILNPVYADAKYFLALSYSRTGKRTEAIAQLKDVQQLNPDRKDIGTMIRNLEAGRDPLAGEASSQAVEEALRELQGESE